MTTTRTIGTGGDHADINAWVAWVAANIVVDGLLTDDVVGAVLSADELVVTSTQDIIGWDVGGSVSGFTTTLTAAAGQSFIDNPGVRTNPLFYDPTKGAAIRQSSSNDPGIVVHVANCTISRLQIAKSHNYQPVIAAQNNVGVDNFVVDSCIVYHENAHGLGVEIGTNGVGGGVKNCLVVLAASTDGYGISVNTVNGFVLDNTIVSLVENTAGQGIHIAYHENTVTNNAIFGFDTDAGGNGSYVGSNNATSLDGTNLTSVGLTSHQVDAVAADEFISATADFRVKPTSFKLKDHGTSMSIGVPTTDISGTAHSAQPTIGAWDVALAPAGGIGTIFFSN